jgi:hypothetical protein
MAGSTSIARCRSKLDAMTRLVTSSCSIDYPEWGFAI